MNADAPTMQNKRRGRRSAGWWGAVVLVIGLFAPISWAGDVVKINSLLTDPESYKMKIVRVEGMVIGHRMNHFIGNVTKLEKCIQQFMVRDDTGTINANYATICSMGGIILQNGDHVTIEAHFSGILDVRSVMKN